MLRTTGSSEEKKQRCEHFLFLSFFFLPVAMCFIRSLIILHGQSDWNIPRCFLCLVNAFLFCCGFFAFQFFFPNMSHLLFLYLQIAVACCLWWMGKGWIINLATRHLGKIIPQFFFFQDCLHTLSWEEHVMMPL